MTHDRSELLIRHSHSFLLQSVVALVAKLVQKLYWLEKHYVFQTNAYSTYVYIMYYHMVFIYTIQMVHAS